MKVIINRISYHLVKHQQDPSLPCLLLLHGFMGSGRVFDHLIKPLSRFVNPVTLDLLGHGRTPGADSAERYHVDYQLEDLHSIVSCLNKEKIFIHGYSMGGRLALRYALQHPETVAGLILESTNYGITDPSERDRRLKLDEQRAAAIESDFSHFLSDWQQLPLFRHQADIPEEMVSSYKAIQQRQDPVNMARSLRGFGTARMPPVKHSLFQLCMPVLLLAGENDKKYRNILNEMDQDIPKSKFHIIRKAGHRIHLEHPRAFIDQVKAFVFSSACNS
ncbi:2-succinyl-6-hydroxy-2,4-cyclohexadiene-1-carboxylate synthase [Halalkalibaculum sp. DA3122]|uniref:2-succinyl-6-hydroxy-2, 4-cyclohexadiene-1-carboxylate synthase n=1 Tax=unclassified Halalkalibaculum TaxID=2964617 RepID=UPI003754BEC7